MKKNVFAGVKKMPLLASDAKEKLINAAISQFSSDNTSMGDMPKHQQRLTKDNILSMTLIDF